jgi:hypothetical protein
MTEENEVDEDALCEGVEKIVAVLDEAAEKLYELADSLNITDEDLEGINAFQTDAEIEDEDELVARIADPIVNALDAATDEINGLTDRVLEMTERFNESIFENDKS